MSTQDIVLEVAADPCLLQGVRGLVRCYLLELGLPVERTDEAVLGVDEACSNAIRHSCQGQREQAFRLVLGSREGWLEIRLEDFGNPAPVEAVQPRAEPDKVDAKTTTPGGLGVQLIYKVFDEVDYCPGHPRGNCVTMKLRLPSPGGGDG